MVKLLFILFFLSFFSLIPLEVRLLILRRKEKRMKYLDVQGYIEIENKILRTEKKFKIFFLVTAIFVIFLLWNFLENFPYSSFLVFITHSLS